MALCHICARDTENGICSYHSDLGDAWSSCNRIMCDFFHRGKILPRLLPHERTDEFWAYVETES